MVTLEQLKKQQKKRKEKQPQQISLLDRLSHIMRKEDISALPRISDASYIPNFNEPEYYTKRGLSLSPFTLVDEMQYRAAKDTIRIADNPYVQFANDFEEVMYSNQLFTLNPDLTEEQLTNIHFKDLIGLEIGREELTGFQEKIRSLEETLEKELNDKVFIFKELTKKVGAELHDSNYIQIENIFERVMIDNVRKKFKSQGNTFDEIKKYIVEHFTEDPYVRIDYSEIENGDELKIITDDATYTGKLKCKCKGHTVELTGSGCQKFKEIYKKTSAEDFTELLGIKPTRGRISRRNLEKIVDEKFEEYFDSLETSEGGTLENIEDYIGKKVKVYPSGKQDGSGSYDCNGDQSDVPPGSEGVIKKIDNGRLIVGFSDGRTGMYKSEIDGRGWHITTREAILIGKEYEISDKVGLTVETVRAIIKKDYDDMVAAYSIEHSAHKMKELDKFRQKASRIKDYIRRIEER